MVRYTSIVLLSILVGTILGFIVGSQVVFAYDQTLLAWVGGLLAAIGVFVVIVIGGTWLATTLFIWSIQRRLE